MAPPSLAFSGAVHLTVPVAPRLTLVMVSIAQSSFDAPFWSGASSARIGVAASVGFSEVSTMVAQRARDADPTPRQLRAAVAEGTRATVVGLIASSFLAVAKVGTGVVGNSYALIADGVESTLDIFSALLVWGGLRVSSAKPNDSFPYGRGKAEHLAALAVATMLLAAAIGIALGALGEIVVPHEAPAAFTLPVLAAVVLAKEAIFRVLSAKGRRLGSQALSTDAWHHRSDALTSLAAFVGISVALIGGEGFESADDWAALLACGVIAWNGVRLFKSAARDVLDVTAPESVHARIRQLAAAAPGVEGVELLRVRRSGLVFFVDIHVEVDGGLSVRKGHEIAHRVKDRLLHSELPVLDALVHIEPAPKTQTRRADDPGSGTEAASDA